MTRGILYAIIMCVMTEGYINAESFYHVYLEPDKAERQVIYTDPGPTSARLTLQPKDLSWSIANSYIDAPDDDCLWVGPYGSSPYTTPMPYSHVYYMFNGYSSREYVRIKGTLTKGGGGSGNNPWFRVTVPDVDIDWDGYEDVEDETDEDTRKEYCPITSTLNDCKKIIIRNPLDMGNMRDDMELLNSNRDLILSWTPASVVRIKDSNGNLYSNGGAINLSYAQNWPLELYVEPISSPLLSDIIITCKGPLGVDGQRAQDKVKGFSFNVELTDSGNIVNDNEYSYISVTPQMPNLSARLKPNLLAGTAKWRLHVEYNRPDRGNYLGDNSVYPDAGWKVLNASSEWNILNEFGGNFRGGKATLYCEYSGVQLTKIFHIRGKNPSSTTAKNYLDANGPWFAYCIAKHESGTHNASRYLQFNEIGNLGPTSSDYKYCPNRGANGSPYGWGIMQLDNIELPGQTSYRSPDNGEASAQELWSWTENCNTGIQVIERKREMAVAHLKSIAPDGMGGYIIPANITVSNVSFTSGGARTSDQLETIKLYNGGHFWLSYDALLGWTHVTIGGTNKDYTEKVLDEF